MVVDRQSSTENITGVNEVYTPRLIEKAKGKLCGICYQYIEESEAENKDFNYSKTKRGSEVFVHRHCVFKECRKGMERDE